MQHVRGASLGFNVVVHAFVRAYNICDCDSCRFPPDLLGMRTFASGVASEWADTRFKLSAHHFITTFLGVGNSLRHLASMCCECYVMVYAPLSNESPLFQFSDGKALTQTTLICCLRNLLSVCNIPLRGFLDMHVALVALRNWREQVLLSMSSKRLATGGVTRARDTFVYKYMMPSTGQP